MDRLAILRAYDEQVRRRPAQGTPETRLESDAGVLRYFAEGWTGIVWSSLDEATADAVIAREVQRFAPLARPWEWKHYSGDTPASLPDRLRAAGFVAEPTETLLVCDLREVTLDASLPAEVNVRAVTDDEGIAALVAVHDEVFAKDHSALRAALAREEPSTFGVIAVAEAKPIAAARVELHPGTRFATLWGGCTVEAWRGRGIYRALIAHRAALAAARGGDFLAVEALDTSRPILERLGFVELAKTTPFIHPGGQ